MRTDMLVAGCLVLAGLAGCASEGGVEHADEPDGLDPQVLWVDAAAPSISFDGQSGSMLSGPGWAPPEGDGGAGDWGSYAWAAATEATLWFTQSFDEDLDFYARAVPYPFGAIEPPQELTLIHGGREVGAVVLRPGWQEVRIPLPRSRKPRALQEIGLRFSRTTKPSEVDDSADSRDLAAAFSTVAVIPRGVTDPLAFLEAQQLQIEGREVQLPVGGAFSWPLPAGRRGSLRIAEATWGCPSCIAEIDLVGRSGTTRLWQGALTDLPAASISFETSGRGISRLVARVTEASPNASRRISTVAFSLPVDFLDLAPADGLPGDTRPHVFLYLVDTLRADTLAAYGGTPELTPRMNAFAERSVTYENARVTSSWTLPSVVSILTGLYPFRHHIMKGDVAFDSEALPGLGRMLAERGYRTVGISQSFVAGDAFGIDGDFGDFFLSNQLNAHALRSQAARTALVHWLTGSTRPEAPIYAYLHTVDPHAPYAPPEGFRELAESRAGSLPEAKYRPSVFMSEGLASMPQEVAHLEALYRGEVAYTDVQFGRFLDLLRHLDLYDSSLVILVSDHGEEFAEHGGFDHGRTLYEELLRVPLIVKYPADRWAGARVARPVSTVDILPTVLGLAGDAAAASSRHGRDLAPSGTGPDADPPRGIFAETDPVAAPHAGAVDLRALAVAELKCIHNASGVDQFGRHVPEWQTFDLGADPAEQVPLDRASAGSTRCRQGLERWLAAAEAENDPDAQGDATSAATRDELRALGYIR